MKKTIAPPPFEDYQDHFGGLEIKVGNHFESDVRKFKALIQKSKILSEYKERQHYEKPSEKKRRKKRETKERLRLLKIKEAMMANGEWDKRQKAKEVKKRSRIERYRKSAEEALE